MRGITEISDDGYEGVSALATEFDRIAGIQIFDEDTGILRDTYDILEDMATVFPTLTANQQQYLSELAAGKNQITVLESLLTNWEAVDKATVAAADSAGSAAKENEAVLNSIEGLSNQLTSSLQNMVSHDILNELIKDFYKLGIAIAGLFDNVIGQSALVGVALTSVSVALAFVLVKAGSFIKGLLELIKVNALATTSTNSLTVSLNVLGAAMTKHPLLFWTGVVATALTALYTVVKLNKDEFADWQSQLSSTADEIKATETEISTLQDKIKENTDLIAQAKLAINEDGTPADNSVYINNLEIENARIKANIATLEQENEARAESNHLLAQQALLTKDISYYQVGDDGITRLANYDMLEYLETLMNTGATIEQVREAYVDLNTALEEGYIIGLEGNEAQDEYIGNLIERYMAFIGIIGEIPDVSEKFLIPDTVPQSAKDYTDSMTALKKAQDNASKSVAYTLDEMEDLLKIAPKLEDAFEATNEGYILSLVEVTNEINNVVDAQEDAIESATEIAEANLKIIESELIKTTAVWSGIEAAYLYAEATGTMTEKIKENYETALNVRLALLNAKDAQLDLIDGYNKASDAITATTGKTSNYISSLSSLESQLATLTQAQYEYNTAGQISISTFESLISLSPSVLSTLINEQGQISINEQSWLNAAQAQAKYMAVAAQAGILDSILAMGSIDEALSYVTLTANDATDSFGDLSLKLADVRTHLEGFAETDEDFAKIEKTLTSASVAMDNIWAAYEALDFSTVTPSAVYSALAGGGSSSSGSGSSGSSSGSSDTDDTIDELKALYDFLEGELEFDYDMGVVSFRTYIETLGELNSMLADNDEYLDEYRANLIKLNDAVSTLFDQEIDDDLLQIEWMTRGGASDQEIIDAYRAIQEKISAQADYYRERGLEGEQEYLDDMGELWWKYQDLVEDRLQDIADTQAEMYKEISDMFADQMSDLMSAMQSDYKAEADALDYIIDMTMDLIQWEAEQLVSALEDQVDLYSEIIELKKASLQATKDEDDYNRQQEETISDIATLQSRIDKLSLDDSREAQAEKAALEEELYELQKDLADSQSEYALDKQLDALDAELEAFEQTKDDELEAQEDMLSSTEKLYQAALDRIDEGFDELYADILEWNYEYGNALQSEVISNWDLANATLEKHNMTIRETLELISQLASSSDAVTAYTADELKAQMQEAGADWYQAYLIGDEVGMKTASDKALALGTELGQLLGADVVRDEKSGEWTINGNPLFDGTSEFEKWQNLEDENEAVKSYITSMKENGTKWYELYQKSLEDGITEEEKKFYESEMERLAAQNVTYGNSIGSIVGEEVWRDPKSGVWYIGNEELFDKYPYYHTGGIVGDDSTLKQNETMAVLENGEMILDAKKEQSLFKLVDFTTDLASKFSNLDLSNASVNQSSIGGLQDMLSNFDMSGFEGLGGSFNPSISVVINSDGNFSEQSAEDFGNQIAEKTISGLAETMNRMGITNFGKYALKQ